MTRTIHGLKPKIGQQPYLVEGFGYKKKKNIHEFTYIIYIYAFNAVLTVNNRMTLCLLVLSVLCSIATLPQSPPWTQLYWVVQGGLWIHPLPWQGVVGDGRFFFVHSKMICFLSKSHLQFWIHYYDGCGHTCFFLCITGTSVCGWNSPCLCPTTWGWWSLSRAIRLCWEMTRRRPPDCPRTSVKGKCLMHSTVYTHACISYTLESVSR